MVSMKYIVLLGVGAVLAYAIAYPVFGLDGLIVVAIATVILVSIMEYRGKRL